MIFADKWLFTMFRHLFNRIFNVKALEVTFQQGEVGVCSVIVESSRRVVGSSSAVTCCLRLTFSHLGPGLKHFACLLSFSCNLRRAACHCAVFRVQRAPARSRGQELMN